MTVTNYVGIWLTNTEIQLCACVAEHILDGVFVMMVSEN